MSRRYPNRRHVDIDLGPERARRRNLNRVSVSIAIIFALLVVLSPFLTDLVSDRGDETPTPALVPVEGALTVDVVKVIDGDTRFPTFEEDEWVEVSRARHAADERNPHDYSFVELARR